MKEVITEIGESRLVHVVTDIGPNYKGAGKVRNPPMMTIVVTAVDIIQYKLMVLLPLQVGTNQMIRDILTDNVMAINILVWMTNGGRLS